MFRSVPALLGRALKVDARLLRTHLLRLLLLGFILWALYMAEETSVFFGAPGLRFFESICWMNFVFITLAGISYFASAITEEKEEMTLGLLKMADINHVSILLGKSTSRLAGALLLLAAQFPFTLLAITLGGVTPHQVLAAYAGLLAYLVLLANVAVLCSVVSKSSHRASWWTGILIGLFLAAPPIVQEFVNAGIGQGTLDPQGFWTSAVITGVDWLQQASIFHRLQVIMTTGFAEPVFSLQVMSNLVVAAHFFAAAWLLFDLCTRNETQASPERGLLTRRRFAGGFFGCGRVWTNPLIWKDFYFLAGGMPMLFGKLVLYGLINGGVAYYSYIQYYSYRTWWSFENEIVGGAIMWCMLIALLLEPAFYAGRIFREEVKWKTLSAVMLLPYTAAEVAYSKIAGCLIALLPAAVWFFLGVLIYPEGFAEGLGETLSEPGGWFAMTQYVLFLHLAAYLSLFVKWGAAPLAFGVMWLTYACCAMGMIGTGPSDEDAFFVMLSFFSLIPVGVLHIATGERLKALAAA